MGTPVREAIANAAIVVTVAPTASESATRGTRLRPMLVRSDSAGSVRSRMGWFGPRIASSDVSDCSRSA